MVEKIFLKVGYLVSELLGILLLISKVELILNLFSAHLNESYKNCFANKYEVAQKHGEGAGGGREI